MVHIGETAKRFAESKAGRYFEMTVNQVSDPGKGGFVQFENHEYRKPNKSNQVPLTIQLIHQTGMGPNTGFWAEINFVGKNWGSHAQRQPVVIAHPDGKLSIMADNLSHNEGKKII